MADDDFDVGSRLKALRTNAGMSQRQLAERASVPHAQISIIEQNKSSPSVSTLRKILGGLGVSMADFFEDDRSGVQEGPFFDANSLVDLTSKIRTHGYLSLRQVGDAKANNLQILHEVYGPGADTGEVLLQHPSNEGGIVIEGEIEVTVGDQVRVLRAGESYLFDSRIPHRFRNMSTATTVVISACTPPYL
ncbi:hypothetical protein N182_28205 [Sinorhizobium sp. GL2]|nr:hypothetical protein N182_28205 [Sinorhizobium sp. GL2]